MPKPRIGLALGGGSARGWSHIGVIEALADADVHPDIVCGCSIGALVGAAYVCGVLPALKEFALSLNLREIARYVDVRVSGGGLIRGQEIVALLRKMNIVGPVEKCALPFAAVATDLESGREIWLREGPIEDAVRASISIPGIFSPARLGDRWLLDGGLVNPVPASLCRALGADIIISVNLNSDIIGGFAANKRKGVGARGVPPEFVTRILGGAPAALREQVGAILPNLISEAPTTPGYFDVLMTSINIMQDQITRTRLAGEPPHVTLAPRLKGIGFLEFHRAGEAIEEGRASVEHAMPFIRRHISPN